MTRTGTQTSGPDLRDRVECYIRDGRGDLHALLRDCVRDGAAEGLSCVRRLYEDMYDGITFNFELKAPAAWTLALWREAGLCELLSGARATPTSKNVSLCVQILAAGAAGTGISPVSFVRDAELASRIHDALTAEPSLADVCRRHLVDLVLSFEADDDVASLVGSKMSHMLNDAEVREVFAALSARWLAVSTPVLERYAGLIAERPHDEPSFQDFLGEHPQLLDPMAVQVWPQPDLLGSRCPDFVLRRADGSYAVVEIESPAKAIATAVGQLSAHVTHAEQQATDYRSYLMEHVATARAHFPGFDDPDCLVVIGLEGTLDQRQRRALRDANRHRHRLRIVGFDWLADRARAVAANIVRHRVEVRRLRMV